jgi:hypothetical protein
VQRLPIANARKMGVAFGLLFSDLIPLHYFIFKNIYIFNKKMAPTWSM